MRKHRVSEASESLRDGALSSATRRTRRASQAGKFLLSSLSFPPEPSRHWMSATWTSHETWVLNTIPGEIDLASLAELSCFSLSAHHVASSVSRFWCFAEVCSPSGALWQGLISHCRSENCCALDGRYFSFARKKTMRACCKMESHRNNEFEAEIFDVLSQRHNT